MANKNDDDDDDLSYNEKTTKKHWKSRTMAQVISDHAWKELILSFFFRSFS